MKHNLILVSSVLLFALCAGVADAHEPCRCESGDHTTSFSARAMLCSSCGFGSKKDNCVLCGKWVANNGVRASLCGSCAFGSKKDDCIRCGKWIGSGGIPASICSSCGFGSKKDNCVRCGKWIGSP